jgi:hypothetical protein
MSTKQAKRIGRPMKQPPRGTRVSLGLKVGADVKRRIDSAARASGRTQSQEAELLIERALQYERLLSAMNTSLEDIRRGQIEAAFRAAGYTAAHSSYGKVWLPKDYPVERSGFIAQEPAGEGEGK